MSDAGSDGRKRILMVVSNPTVSEQTGWTIGFWWAELTHPYWEFVQKGFEVDIASPDGGELTWDSWSDPRDGSGYSSDDLLSLGFINSPRHMELLKHSIPLSEVDIDRYDGVFLVGGQAPMYTFYNDDRIQKLVAGFYEAQKITALVCHATSVLLKTRLSNGQLLVDGRTWTGFADSEEEYTQSYVGQKIQPFWIEDEAKALNTNFVVGERFQPHAIRDENLITGQQQHSGAAAARLVIEALGG